ncbi:hypothetical protein BKA69DRAFT_1089273 [Paraphysoderma sedebokerense]|nr:hypothetical protein BKA69DRAFT_1089273 [Paraphysoderma sedebokerense]
MLEILVASFRLPYWDEGADFTIPLIQNFQIAPLETPLFSAQYMGSVTVGQNQCLQAPSEGWMHDGQCVSRNVRRATISTGGTQSAWIVPAQTLAFGLSRISTFEEFAMLTESVPHDLTHMWVNGNMGRADPSPADPMFWLHHNYVDFIWATWQRIRILHWCLTFLCRRLCYAFEIPVSPRTAGRLAKRQAETQPSKLPFLASLTDDEIKQISPRIKIEDYRKAEKALNNITTVINDLLQNGTPLSSFKTVSQLYQEGSGPTTTSSAFALDSGSVGLIASVLVGFLYSLF